jgi:hypothetical protein
MTLVGGRNEYAPAETGRAPGSSTVGNEIVTGEVSRGARGTVDRGSDENESRDDEGAEEHFLR